MSVLQSRVLLSDLDGIIMGFFQLAQTVYLSIILSYPCHRFACFQKTILTLQAFGKLVDIFGH